MIMKPLLLYLCGILMLAAPVPETIAQAGDSPGEFWYLVKDNPEEIYVLESSSDACPGAPYTDVISSEFKQSRIRPILTGPIPNNELSLIVSVSCSEKKDLSAFVFRFDIRFGKFLESPTKELDGAVVIQFISSHGNTYGIVNKDRASQQLRDALREVMSNQLADYLKANFDM